MGHRGLDLSGKVAVVVGATSGIGRELALGLAQAGADVVATARRAAQVDEVAAEIEALGRKTVRVACDVTDAASLVAARADDRGEARARSASSSTARAARSARRRSRWTSRTGRPSSTPT